MKYNTTFSILILFVLMIILYITMQTMRYVIRSNHDQDDDSFVKEMIVNQNIGESVRNSNQQIFIEENTQNKIPISDSPILVLRYSSFACNICIEFAIEQIKNNFQDYNSNSRILYIVSDYKSKTKTKTNYPNCISINNSNIGLSLEDTKLPFYFILINGRAYHVFIPDKSVPEQTKIYLEEIKKRYLSNARNELSTN